MIEHANLLQNLFLKNPKKILKIVLTGGPGVGKTSILKYLEMLNFEVRVEVFTELFAQAENMGKFKELFNEPKKLIHNLVISQKKIESSLPQRNVIFYDRSMIDIIGFAEQLKINFSNDDLKIVNESKYDLVFIIEPIHEKYYVQNSIRRQNYKESLDHHQMVKKSYIDYCKKNSLNPNDFLISVPDLQINSIYPTVDKNSVEKMIQIKIPFILEKILKKFENI